MEILIFLHHPAHFHLFKNIIYNLKSNGHAITLLATKKDNLETLLENEGLSYINVLPDGRENNKFAIALGLLKQDYGLLKICLRHRPDLLLGTSTEICHIGWLMNIPSIFTNEDDVEIIPLVGKIAYPFARQLLLPSCCNAGKWEHKSIKYSGYHELAYLHPNHFSPDKEIVTKYFKSNEKYFIMRFAKLTAHHDKGARGITTRIAEEVIKTLEPCGNIYVTSERELEPQFEKYRMIIDPRDIHHIMAFAELFIGDSQTMAAEAGVLGTPFIRFNDFVGRIGYLADLEDKYKLGFGIRTCEEERLYSIIKILINTPDLKKDWQNRRQKMLAEKIDVTAFLTWFVEKFPESSRTMKENPEYQFKFK